MASLWTNNTSHEATIMADDSVSISQAALYTILPSVVSKRIPRIPRLRSSLKQALSHYDATYAKRISLSNHLRARSLTPPPSYHSTPDDIEPTTDEDPESEPVLYRSRTASTAPSRPSSSGSSTPAFHPHESTTTAGIQWKYSDAGLALLSLASQETLPTLVRRQYIDGVACLLRGLPEELSGEEEMSLREAMPACLSSEEVKKEVGALTRGRGQFSSNKTVPVSSLQRSVAAVTLYVFLAVAFVLPYLQLLLRSAYEYDRKYKVSDRVWARSVVAADAVGKRTLMLAASFCELNEGRVGDSLREVGMYVVQGVSGGVYDGVGEALRVRGREGDER